VKGLASFIFTCLIDFVKAKALMVARMSRMSEFNSKFGGGATIAMPRIPQLSAHANIL